jgi:hypothetical protein
MSYFSNKLVTWATVWLHDEKTKRAAEGRRSFTAIANTSYWWRVSMRLHSKTPQNAAENTKKTRICTLGEQLGSACNCYMLLQCVLQGAGAGKGRKEAVFIGGALSVRHMDAADFK